MLSQALSSTLKKIVVLKFINFLQLPTFPCATTCLGPALQLAIQHAVTVKKMRDSVQGTQRHVSVTHLAESSTIVALTWTKSAQEKVQHNDCDCDRVCVCVCVIVCV